MLVTACSTKVAFPCMFSCVLAGVVPTNRPLPPTENIRTSTAEPAKSGWVTSMMTSIASTQAIDTFETSAPAMVPLPSVTAHSCGGRDGGRSTVTE